MAIVRGLVPVAIGDPASGAKPLLFELRRRIETLPALRFATARSRLPSPLKSADSTPKGLLLLPTEIGVPSGAKLAWAPAGTDRMPITATASASQTTPRRRAGRFAGPIKRTLR